MEQPCTVEQSDAKIGSLQKFIYPAFAPEELTVITYAERLVSLCKKEKLVAAATTFTEPF